MDESKVTQVDSRRRQSNLLTHNLVLPPLAAYLNKEKLHVSECDSKDESMSDFSPEGTLTGSFCLVT